MDSKKRKKLIKEHKKRVNLIFKKCIWEEFLAQVLEMTPEEMLDRVKESGLRGRGGAGFPTWLKWKSARDAESVEKFIICNADEGEPGTFKDRAILKKQAGKVFPGMLVCAKVIGAEKGFIYLRGEYAYLLPQLSREVDNFNKKLKEKGECFNIEIKLGSGAYVCGEETALIESLEGNRGEPRNKPPFPTTEGYLGKPTVVHNVETLVYASIIISEGPKCFKKLGTSDSAGAKVFCVSGDTDVEEGIYELEMGMKILEFVRLFSDGDIKAVQVGGASGFCVPRKKFADTVLGFEGIPTGGAMMLFKSSRSMYNVLHNFLEFFVEESCGQCTPCRVGCQQLLKGIEAVKTGEKPSKYLDELIKLAKMMKISAKCGLGQSAANPFISIIENFREEVVY